MGEGDGAATLDLLGVGNAIVDVLSQADDGFLAERGIAKGAMTLIDDAQADVLYEATGPGVEVSGGSCANTVAGAASLGSAVAFVGRVRDDLLGRVFTHDLRAAGVEFATPPAGAGPGTARCLIMVTPDAQRTMCTYLGASIGLGPEDIDAAQVARAAVTYAEGYLWDPPRAKEAIRTAFAAARGAGRRTALSLSDRFCVERHRAELLALAREDVDILFANEDEARALFAVDDLDAALARLADACETAAVTRGPLGSVLLAGGARHDVPAEPVDRVVDTTGAGDLYAAGVLHGLVRAYDPATCARLGGLAAAEVIGHFGARPETSLRALADRVLASA